jgi:pyrroline-5-carboxylate reductase
MKLGFIGCGNMASAIMSGIISNGLMKPDEIIGADVFAPSRERVKENLGIQIAENNVEVVQKVEAIVLSVKPQFYEEVIREIKKDIKDHQIIITLAPGKTLQWLEEQFGKPVKIVRTMPNTPAMVQEGMTAACPNLYVTSEEIDYVCSILKAFGDVEVIPEKMMDAVVAVSGSSPAYVYMMIEAMADAAVAEGMPRNQAIKFAAKAVQGSAKMVLETGKHPGELKDMVCSPGGTTIEAVKVLEETGFRGSIMQAMEVCAEKSRNM